MKASDAAPARNRLRLFRFGRVPVYVNPTWLIFGALIVYFFGPLVQARFPMSVFGAVLWGVAAALMFAFSVLVHELGHVLAARAYRTRVVEVELNILGGFTRYATNTMKPLQEAAMAAAGPLASFALGFVLWGIGLAAGATPLGFLAITLGQLNWLLAVFNLLPASSLDGGKIVESVMQHFTGRQKPGLVVTTAATVLLLLAGVVYLVGTETGRLYLTQPWWLVMMLAVAGFLIINLLRSWKRLKMTEALTSLSVDRLSEPAPEFVHTTPLAAQTLIPFNAPPEEVLETAGRTRAPYLVVIDAQNRIGGIIRYQRSVETIASNEQLAHLLGKDR